MHPIERAYRYLFVSASGSTTHFIARWLYLRALGFIYLSAFYALLFQVKGLIGSHGILPAADYLQTLRTLGPARFWYAPTLLWLSSSDHLLLAICWVGLIAAILLIANIWPRATLVTCFLCFLSFVTAAREFSSYQSDSMLLEAGFISLFLAPPGFFPGLAAKHPVRRAALFLLLWEWFRIYFQSGVVKLESGDPTWRNLTALYEYYQNGPLPTWIGWYLQHLPNWFHIASAGATLIMELVLVWMAFLPGRWRIACCVIVTAWQTVVIATANYAFLNYLVLILAVLLLDDQFLRRFVPERWRFDPTVQVQVEAEPSPMSQVGAAVACVALSWVFYATTLELLLMFWPSIPLPTQPVVALEPLRIANQYGLFAVMTPHRYEIEFQGSNDGVNWTPYPFRYKPQDIHERPGIYAPYQPRFDWNLWFASLGSWDQNQWVPRTEELLLQNDADVLSLFRSNPFRAKPPRMVRAVIWQYWFSTPEEKRKDGVWWRRQLLGLYAPTITQLANGHFAVLDDNTFAPAAQP